MHIHIDLSYHPVVSKVDYKSANGDFRMYRHKGPRFAGESSRVQTREARVLKSAAQPCGRNQSYSCDAIKHWVSSADDFQSCLSRVYRYVLWLALKLCGALLDKLWEGEGREVAFVICPVVALWKTWRYEDCVYKLIAWPTAKPLEKSA